MIFWMPDSRAVINSYFNIRQLGGIFQLALIFWFSPRVDQELKQGYKSILASSDIFLLGS